ncbi:hypothetical protein K8I61_05585, partial [bacterium]|nr:hypothetical protein [bacterium]
MRLPYLFLLGFLFAAALLFLSAFNAGVGSRIDEPDRQAQTPSTPTPPPTPAPTATPRATPGRVIVPFPRATPAPPPGVKPPPVRVP